MNLVPEKAEQFRRDFEALETEIGKVIVGQSVLIRHVLVALIARGHVLIEGLPGLGKTLLIRTLGRILDLNFSRIQFTPDLMPSDILGTEVLDAVNPKGRRFEPGPLFANLVLADEINRATPKTQSALLEAMQEGNVTFLGQCYTLSQPFLVMATQNPIDLEGTYPLPEAQRDRFFCQLNVPFPDSAELIAIADRTTGVQETDVRTVLDGHRILEMASFVREVPAAEEIKRFAAALVLATQPGSSTAHPAAQRLIRFGASPRGMQALLMAGKVLALL
ncbi:MAG TPA: AAA family ATPase, partial [bacterium]|nr:AAA family ATPase [bacterium]